MNLLLANCGPDGCEALPVPLRWALGAKMLSYVLVILYSGWRERRRRK